MAELADAADSKSADRKVVGVRPPLPAPYMSRGNRLETRGIEAWMADTTGFSLRTEWSDNLAVPGNVGRLSMPIVCVNVKVPGSIQAIPRVSAKLRARMFVLVQG